MEELKENLLCLAGKIQENQRDEAEAVAGYTEQGATIARIRNKAREVGNYNLEKLCDEWEAKTDELIADELNHQKKLVALYSSITGIDPATD